MKHIRTPDQRVRVFVSSTLKELAKDRAAAKEAIDRLRLTPVLFELGARPHPPQDLYRAYLEQSDIFVGIYWQEYGWIAPGAEISGLEEEYLLAAGMPKLIYLREPAPDRDPRLSAMLDRLRTDREVSYRRFSTLEELSRLIQDDLAVLMSERFERGKQTRDSRAVHEEGGRANARTALPTGTVTFLFTDIEGSTRLLQETGNLYPDLLNTHHQLLRTAFEAHGGREVSSEGDSLFVVFANPSDAVAASVAAQRLIAQHPWPDGRSLRVRMGLHTGEGKTAVAGYVGLDVHRAARISAAAHGGQVLVSDTTHALVKDSTPDAVAFRDLGEHRLKDLPRLQRLFQVVAQDLASSFPPLKSLSSLPNNLPLQLTSFVGREREMAEIKSLLSRSRLLTLAGAGGSGKTRVALQIAADLLDQYTDGAWLVELAPVSDAGLLAQTVATALNLHEQPARTFEATLVDYLHQRQLVLVLDNCEHLLSACARLVETLLRACPQLRVLATSREGLGIAGELIYRVPSLAVPDPRELTSANALSQNEAVRLFVDRAMLAAPGFSLTGRNAAAVAQICTRLDGIPLAIELAAGRIKGMSAEQIALRLDDRFRLLSGGSRTALPRHQTLQAAMDWSHELLAEPERIFLRRLSVFVGGWTLEAAEEICAGDGVDRAEALDLMMRLVDKSLVVTDDSEGETRYRFLETVHQYCRDKLIQQGEAERLRDRHQAWFLSLAERAEPNLIGREQGSWLDRLETEHPNLRAALEWSRSGEGAPEDELRLAAALWRFWNVRGYWREGREWLAAALSRVESPPAALMAKALFGAGVLAWRQRDIRADVLLNESLSLARELGDKRTIADSLRLLGMVASHRHDFDQARALGEESLDLSRDLQDDAGISAALRFLAVLAAALGEFDRAVPALEESLRLARALGDQRGIAWSLYELAEAARARADYAAAVPLYDEALPILRNVGDRLGLALTLDGLGLTALCRGDDQRAAELLGESSRLCRDLGNKYLIGVALHHLGLLSQDQGDDEAAKRLQEESHALLREAGNRPNAGRAWVFADPMITLARVDPLCALGEIALREGDYTRADAYLQEGLAFFRMIKNHWAEACALHHLGALAHALGNGSQGSALLQEALELRRDLGDKRGVAESLEGLAAVAVFQEQFERAATLLAAAEALRAAIDAPLAPARGTDHERSVNASRKGVDEKAFSEAWTRGRKMSIGEAIAYALE